MIQVDQAKLSAGPQSVKMIF